MEVRWKPIADRYRIGTAPIEQVIRLGFISPVLKQFSGHASLKSLEEYVVPDELRHNYPLKDVL